MNAALHLLLSNRPRRSSLESKENGYSISSSNFHAVRLPVSSVAYQAEDQMHTGVSFSPLKNYRPDALCIDANHILALRYR